MHVYNMNKYSNWWSSNESYNANSMLWSILNSNRMRNMDNTCPSINGGENFHSTEKCNRFETELRPPPSKFNWWCFIEFIRKGGNWWKLLVFQSINAISWREKLAGRVKMEKCIFQKTWFLEVAMLNELWCKTSHLFKLRFWCRFQIIHPKRVLSSWFSTEKNS